MGAIKPGAGAQGPKYLGWNIKVREHLPRRFAAIDTGMANFIQAISGCKEADIPKELDRWMRYEAVGVGVVRRKRVRRKW